MPAFKGFVYGGQAFGGQVIWQVAAGFAIDGVFGTYLQLFKLVQHIYLSNDELGEAIELSGVAQCGQVYPATAARTAGGGTKLSAQLAQPLPFLTGKFRWERATAYTGAICLADTIHFPDFCR